MQIVQKFIDDDVELPSMSRAAEDLFHRFYGRGADSFKELLLLLPDRTLKALDVGCGDGGFARNLFERNSDRFSSVTGVDLCSGTSIRSLDQGRMLELVYNTRFEDFAAESSEKYDLIIFNSPAISIDQSTISNCNLLLNGQGMILVALHWEMFLTNTFNAFNGEPELACFYANAGAKMGLHRDRLWLLRDMADYPETLHRRVPGALAYFPEGVGVKDLDNANPIVATATITEEFARLSSVYWFLDGEAGVRINMRFSHGSMLTILQPQTFKDFWMFDEGPRVHEGSLRELLPKLRAAS